MASNSDDDEEDYIDIKVNTSYSIIKSPSQTTDFQFQKLSSSIFHDKNSNNLSAAHHLFYPLFKNSSKTEPHFSKTPFQSCNISPCDDYLFRWSSADSMSNRPKKTWSEKLKDCSSMAKKLRSLFTKSACSKAKECLSRYIHVRRRNPFGYFENHRFNDVELKRIENVIVDDEEGGACNDTKHRRSFSETIKRHIYSTKGSSTSSTPTSSSGSSSLSSSFSFNLNRCHDLHLLKRSTSDSSENESSIEGAIAYCKQSFSETRIK